MHHTHAHARMNKLYTQTWLPCLSDSNINIMTYIDFKPQNKCIPRPIQTIEVPRVLTGTNDYNFRVYVDPQEALRSACLCIKSRIIYSEPPTTCFSSQLLLVLHLLPAPFTDMWAGADTQGLLVNLYTHSHKHKFRLQL